MDITPKISANAKVIQGYTPGSVRISSVVYTAPVFVTPETVMPWDGTYDSLVNLSVGVEILLVGGVGDLPADIRNRLRTNGVGVDMTDLGAACRTFNVLMAEGRKVAAALRI